MALPDVSVLPGERYLDVLTADLPGQMDLVLPLLQLHGALGLEAAQPGEFPLGERNVGDLHVGQVGGPEVTIIVSLGSVLQ